MKVTRALADWQAAEAYALLWELATSGKSRWRWPAAKALATATENPAKILHDRIDQTLVEAEASTKVTKGGQHSLSEWGDPVGNTLA